MNGKHQINVPVVLAFLRHPELQVSLSNPERKRMQKLIRAVFEGGVIAFCPQLFYYEDTSHYKFNLLLRLVDLVHLFSLDLQWSL